MRKNTRNGLVGMLTAGAIAVSGAVCALRDNELKDGWKRCELYVENPRYPAFVQKVLDKIPVGIDDTMKHPENGRVYCSDYKSVIDDIWTNFCFYRLTSKKEEEQDLIANLVEERISEDVYKFSELNINGFENNPEKLMEVVENSPWIFEGALNGGYVVENVRDDKGKIVERHYDLANGKKVVAVDSDKNGTLDRYKEE